MGNTHVKPHPRSRNKKQVHWRAADRPSPPGKPSLATDNDFTPEDAVTIRWPKPVNDGGSPITGYLVEHRRTGSPHWVRSTPMLVQFPELTISGLEPGWRYQFRVRAENAVGLSEPGELSEPLTLTLQRSAIIPPKFTQELHDTTALENEKAEFVVHFLGQPPPKVCWFKDGFEIFSSRRTRIITESDKSILTIHQSALADEGEIKCTATNKAGHCSTKAKLTLEAPPNIRLPRQYEDGLLFEIGEQMRLKVSVAGRPTPLIFWYHNGETLQNSDRYEMSFGDKSSILKMEEAQRSDRGEYQVKAVNKLGEDTASFLVTVTDRPSPPGKARVVMTLGRSVTITWSVPYDDGGCKIGNYIIEYYRVGWNVWLKAATSRQLSTVLGDLIEGSEYKFRVKAESPYGISDPSDETDPVFIPDPKRGILTPERSRSQPRDIVEEIMTPVAARRKKPRSQSSSRAESPQMRTNSNHCQNGVPVRPERTKIKSPQKSPQASPKPPRKHTKPLIDSEIFDRASMAREMAYGSPEIKVKKNELGPPQTDYLLSYSSGSDKSDRSIRSRSPSPFVDGPRKPQERRVSIYSVENLEKPPSPSAPPKAPTPPRYADDQIQDIQRRFTRQQSENATGSSEFMLVLYPDENEKVPDEIEHWSFSFDDDLIPPPLSLSAPELGTEPPAFENLRRVASSTELLHERAMLRFYEAIEAEEAEKVKQGQTQERKQSVIPKIKINSNEDLPALEKQPSIKRRKSLSTTGQQHSVWTQRRHSLRGPNDIMQVVEQKLHKVPKSEAISRQRSGSSEREELEIEKVRQVQRSVQSQSSFEKKRIEVVEEEKWEDDDSISEESESDDGIHREEANMPRIPSFEEEDEDTYHPGIINTNRKRQLDEPFEILTKRKDLPDPNFVPKPILKRADNEVVSNERPSRAGKHENTLSRMRTHSPMPTFRDRSVSLASEQTGYSSKRDRSISLTLDELDVSDMTLSGSGGIDKPKQMHSQERKNSLLSKIIAGSSSPKRDRSASLIDEPKIEISRHRFTSLTSDNLNQLMDYNKSSENISSPVSSTKNISAVASISGVAAASVIIPGELLKKKAEEEAKVVIDHYGDILRSYSSQKKKTEPKVESNVEPEEESFDVEREEPPLEDFTKPKDNEQTKPNLAFALGEKVQNIPWPRQAEHVAQPHEVMQEEHWRSKNIEEKIVQEKLKLDGKELYLAEEMPENKHHINERILINKEEKLIKKEPPRKLEESPTFVKKESIRSSENRDTGNESESPLGKRRYEKAKKSSSSRSSSGSRYKRTPSKSPHRLENWSDQRKGSPYRKSPSPEARRHNKSPTPDTYYRSHSPSPIAFTQRRPKMKEIMTQTSIGLEYYAGESRTSTPSDSSIRQEILMAQAEEKVRSAVDYLTDFAMFAVACYLYIFSNELLAIPVLIVMVYRQTKEAVQKRLKRPKWLKMPKMPKLPRWISKTVSWLKRHKNE